MDTVRYKLTNTTKWPGHTKGRHKHGWILAIERKNVHVNKHIVVDSISEGIEALQTKRWLKIEPILNQHVTIKAQIAETEKANEKARVDAEQALKDKQTKTVSVAKAKATQEVADLRKAQEKSEPNSSLDKEQIKSALKADMPASKARVPQEDESEDPLAGVDEPAEDNSNFVVRAPSTRGHGQHKSKK